jgi:hypothetical protein
MGRLPPACGRRVPGNNASMLAELGGKRPKSRGLQDPADTRSTHAFRPALKPPLSFCLLQALYLVLDFSSVTPSSDGTLTRYRFIPPEPPKLPRVPSPLPSVSYALCR